MLAPPYNHPSPIPIPYALTSQRLSPFQYADPFFLPASGMDGQHSKRVYGGIKALGTGLLQVSSMHMWTVHFGLQGDSRSSATAGILDA